MELKLRTHKLQTAVYAALVSQALLLGQHATAQTVLEEVLITSTRRATNVQDTPLAVSAITMEALNEQSIENTQDLTSIVPNVQIYGGPANTTFGSFYIRGIPRVGTYIDGVWQVSSAGLLQRQFVELERIEVLRGPQGTLVGRDSTGGSVQIFTKRPSDELAAKIDIASGSFGRRDVSASIDVPLTDTLKSKWTVASYDKDGYVESVTTGQNHGELENRVARGDIVWDPTDKFSVRFIHQQDYQLQTSAGVQTFINPRVAYNNGWQVGIAEAHDIASLAAGGRGFNCKSTVAGCEGGLLNEYQSTKRQSSPDEVNTKSNSLIVDYEINDIISAKYIYGDTRFNSEVWSDYAGSEFNFFTNYDLNKTEYTSHEFQFNISLDRINAVVGAFSWDQSTRTRGVEWSHSDWVFPEGWGNGKGGQVGGGPPVVFQTRNSGRPQTLDYRTVLNSAACKTTPAQRGLSFKGLDPNSVNGWPQPCTAFAAWVPLFSTVVGFNSTNGLDGSDRSNYNSQEGQAFFGELTYDINDRWDVTAGARYHDQDNEAAAIDIANGKKNGTVELRPITWDTGFANLDRAVGGAILADDGSDDFSFSKTSLRFVTSYDFYDNIMGYASYSEGFNSGGVSITVDSIGRLVTPFAPETLENTEIGMRGDFFDGRLRVNATYFMTDWLDIQLAASVIDRGTGLPVTETTTQNASNGEASGIEMELTYSATDAITLGANIGTLDTQYKGIKSGAQITADTEFGGAPDKSYSLWGTYDWNLAGGATLSGRLQANYTGLFWRSPVPSYREDAYGGNTRSGDIWRLNARAIYVPADSNFTVQAYVNNLTNEYYINSGFMDSIWQFDFAGVDTPREYGISLSMSF
jgi:iron complex outermembrane recepter protein